MVSQLLHVSFHTDQISVTDIWYINRWFQISSP